MNKYSHSATIIVGGNGIGDPTSDPQLLAFHLTDRRKRHESTPTSPPSIGGIKNSWAEWIQQPWKKQP